MDSIITQVTPDSVAGGGGGGGMGGSTSSAENNYHHNNHHRQQDLDEQQPQSSTNNKQNSLLRQRRIVSDKSSTSSSVSNNKNHNNSDNNGGSSGNLHQQSQQNGSSNSAVNFLRKLLNSCCCCVRKQQGTSGRGKDNGGSSSKSSGGTQVQQQQQQTQGAWGDGEMFVGGGGEVRSISGGSSTSSGASDDIDSLVGGIGSVSMGVGSGGSSAICSGERGFLLPPCLPQDRSKPCMVIDLDETLVHSSFKPISNADFIVPVEIDGIVHQVYVAKRPYVDEFLQKMGELYECVLFTASLAKYADPVADLLDKWGVFRTRLFRDACVFHRGNYVKDLNKLGRSLHRVVIVDNSPASYIFHPDNAVPVASWFDDTSDTELLYLIPFFERLSSVENVYTVLRNSNHPYNSINKDPNNPQSNLAHQQQSPLHHAHLLQQQPPPPPPPNYNSIIHNLQQPQHPQSSSVSSSSNQAIHQNNASSHEDAEIILSKSQTFSNRNSNDS